MTAAEARALNRIAQTGPNGIEMVRVINEHIEMAVDHESWALSPVWEIGYVREETIQAVAAHFAHLGFTVEIQNVMSVTTVHRIYFDPVPCKRFLISW
jgi:hypothetical protein